MQMSVFSRRASRVAGHLDAPVLGETFARGKAGRRFICREKPSSAAAAPLPSIFARVTKRVLRSTWVPTEERLAAPLSKCLRQTYAAPLERRFCLTQWPGTRREFTSSGR